MRGTRLLLAALALACGCGGGGPAIPARDLLIRVRCARAQVELGKAFEVSIERVWSKELVPGALSEKALAPLVAQLLETTRREDEQRIEETRRYRCYAFSLEDLSVAPITFSVRPLSGGAPRRTTSEALHLRVATALDPAAPGPPELPGGPLEEPFTWWPWTLGAAAALAAAVALAWFLPRRSRRQPELSAAQPPPPPPHCRALERIQHLRAQRPLGRTAIQAFHIEAAALVREYLEERFELCRPQTSTEELLAAPATARMLSAGQRDLLARCLAPCDLVKFARLLSSEAEREQLVNAAEQLVQETRSGADRAGSDAP